jgi:hypothetical protein
MSRTLAMGSVAVVGLLVGALATYFLRPAPSEWCAKPKHHCIVVTVDGANAIDVQTDPLGKKGPDHRIRWIIPPERPFSFPGNGIVFATAGEFDCTQPSANTFECLDSNGTRGEFKYTVAVTSNSTGTPNPQPIDPRIVNN